jgi:hypothetical protein
MTTLYPFILRLCLALTISCFASMRNYAQERHTNGARSAGLANATVALTGPESLFGNPAGLAGLNQVSFFLFHESRFLIKDFTASAAGLSFPLLRGSCGVGFRQFGRSHYREQLVSFTLARRFGEAFSAALLFSRGSVQFPGHFTYRPGYTLEMGAILKSSPELSWGFHMANPFSDTQDAAVSRFRLRQIRLGNVWKISGQLIWCTEIEKTATRKARVKTGLEFMPDKLVTIRAGIIGYPFQPTGGAGFRFGRYAFDIAFIYQTLPGFTPVAAITCVI